MAQELKLPNSQIKASLEYLRAHHPESFKSKREVYETIKSLLKNNDYLGDSLKNKNAAYIAKQNDELISDMAINRDSGGVFHLNKDRKMSNSEIERMASAVGTSNSQHKQLVPWAQMNTSKEHFSPTNGEILPQKSDFTPNFTQENKIVGNGFLAKDGDLNYTDRVRFELGEYLKNNLNLNDNPLNASLNYLFNHHREMFNSRRDVLNSVKELLDSIPEVIKKREDGSYYLAKSITHTPTNRSSKMIDMTIEPQSNENYINHLNRGKYNKNMREAMDKIISDGKDAPLLTHQSELTGALSDNHSGLYSRSSPINGEILPQNADNFAQNLDQSAQNLSNANLNAPNLSNANFHNPRAEFSANNAYENFSNPNNPHAFMNGGGGENPRFMPYSPSQNPRANARELQERTGFLNGEHLGAKEASLMNGSVDFTHLKKADFEPNSSANLAFESANDVLTWRAQSANVGENLKPNGANTARTNEVNQGANEAQNGANLGANSTTPHASEINLDATPHANSANQKADKANEGVIPQELAQGSVNFSTLKKVDFTPSKTSTKNGEIPADKNAFNKLENEKFEAIKNEQKRREEIELKAQEADLRSANGANSNRANGGADEANLRAQQEAINEQEHLNANSLTNDTRANEANLRAQQEANLGSADTPKAKLTKEQNEAQKLLKQILKALKTSPTKKAFSISTGEKQTWENAINEKLKELKEKEQILKEQPSANFGEVPHTLAQPSLNLNALEKMKFSLSQEAALKAKIKAQKAKLEERANKNLEALIKKEQTAHTKTSQEVQQQALQDAGEAEEKLGALLDYAKSKENNARNFINSLLLRSTLGAGYGALANKDDRLKGAMIGAGAGAIGIPLLRALPHNFQTTVIKNALSGGVIGATSDSDNRVRGAMIGALAGASGVPLALKVAEKLGAKANYNQNLREAMLDLHKNKGWRNIDDSFSGLIKRNFSDTLGGEYRELESQMNANINKQMYHLQDTFKSLSNLSEDVRRDAHLYLSGELDKSVNLEPNLKAQPTKYTKEILTQKDCYARKSKLYTF